MFKKTKLLLCAVGALGFLVSCNSNSTPADDTSDFDQNGNKNWEGFSMYIIGSHWNSWDTETIKTANPSCAFTEKSDEKGVFTYTANVTSEMVNAWCGFKFISDASWSSQYGLEDVNYEKSNAAFRALMEEQGLSDRTKLTGPTSKRSNIVASKAGTYVITYYPNDFSTVDVDTDAKTLTNHFTVDFTAAA